MHNIITKVSKIVILAIFLMLVTGCNGLCSVISSNPINTGNPADTESKVLVKIEQDQPNGENQKSYRNGDAFLARYQNDSLVKQVILV